MDLTPSFKSIADESLVDRAGEVVKYKRYDFYLGKFGPFTERVPLEGFSDTEITRRVALLKAHIENLHR